MYPNQNDPNQVPPVAPVDPYANQPQQPPQPQQVVEPVVSPLVQPIEPVAFEPIPQPVAQPITQSFQPPQPSQDFQMEQQLVTPPAQIPVSTPQPQQFIPPVQNSSAPFGQKKSGKKIFVIIGILLLLAGLITAGIIFLPNLLASSGLKLKEYSNERYSILIPEEYNKEEYGDSASFTEIDKENNNPDSISRMSVSAAAAEGVSKSDRLIQLDETYNKESLTKMASLSTNQTIENFKLDKSKINGKDARSIYMDVVKDSKTIGSAYFVFIITDEYTYTILIQAHSSDPGFKANANKIINSFKIK